MSSLALEPKQVTPRPWLHAGTATKRAPIWLLRSIERVLRRYGYATVPFADGYAWVFVEDRKYLVGLGRPVGQKIRSSYDAEGECGSLRA